MCIRDSIISAIEMLLFKAPIQNEYNFSSNEEITINNLVRLICELTSTNFDEIVTFGPERLGKDMHYRLNCQKSKSQLNWETKTTQKEGILNVLSWIDRNKNFLSNEEIIKFIEEKNGS